jgi:hypothetical protein
MMTRVSYDVRRDYRKTGQGRIGIDRPKERDDERRSVEFDEESMNRHPLI